MKSQSFGKIKKRDIIYLFTIGPRLVMYPAGAESQSFARLEASCELIGYQQF